MDERRTLVLLGWSVGGIVGLMFLLNAIALSSEQSATTKQLISPSVQPIEATASLGLAVRASGI
jgi:hypothetical protein